MVTRVLFATGPTGGPRRALGVPSRTSTRSGKASAASAVAVPACSRRRRALPARRRRSVAPRARPGPPPAAVVDGIRVTTRSLILSFSRTLRLAAAALRPDSRFRPPPAEYPGEKCPHYAACLTGRLRDLLALPPGAAPALRDAYGPV